MRAAVSGSDVLRASGYIFILAVQLLAIWYSKSRGPWLGIVAAAFIFPYLGLIVLQRQAAGSPGAARGRFTDMLKGLGFGIGTLGLAGGLAAGVLVLLSGPLAIYLALGLAALVFGGLWLYFIVERKGWQWLWIGWGSVGMAVAAALLAVNVPGPLQTHARKVPSLVRLTEITELQEGTGKVRGLIWQGTVALISPHAPIAFPDGSVDRFNWLRPLFGYGPESMYVAYNSFYPPELGHYESRTASPDRSHNETLDSLVITGVFGLAAYLFTFVSFFAWGFHWLGLLKSRRALLAYIGLDVFFAVVFFLIAWQVEGAYLFAVAIPLGVLVGTMIYLTWQAFARFFKPEGASDPKSPVMAHPHSILIMGLLAGVIAHFVEINFGIAIAATRTTFWVFAALLVVLGLRWLPGLSVQTEGEPETVSAGSAGSRSKRSRKRRRQSQPRQGTLVAPWMASVVMLSLAGTFLLSTLAFDFINNPDRLGSAWQIFVQSLTTKYYPQPTRAYGALMVFTFTWVMFGVVGLGEFDREGLFSGQRRRRWGTAIAIYAGVSLLGTLVFGLLLSGFQAMLTGIQVTTLEEVVGVADKLTGLLGYYYALIFVVVLAGAWVLMRENARPRDAGGTMGYAVLIVGMLVSIPIVRSGSYNLIRADIIFKQGGVFANSTNSTEKQLGIQHFEKAIEYAPHEDYYHLFLGKALLELAQGLPDTTPSDQRTALFEETENILDEARALNPLNTDHSANLARFYKSWAARVSIDMQADGVDAATLDSLASQRADLLNRSLENYKIALTLSPHNAILWNELAQLYGVDLGDISQFQATITRSLEIDDGFEQTWMLLGDFRRSEEDYTGAIDAYQHSLEIKENCTVERVVGTLLAQQARYDEAVSSLTHAVDVCADNADVWDMFRVLAISYAGAGQIETAQQYGQLAVDMAPDDQKAVVQQILDQFLSATEPAPSP